MTALALNTWGTASCSPATASWTNWAFRAVTRGRGHSQRLAMSRHLQFFSWSRKTDAAFGIVFRRRAESVSFAYGFALSPRAQATERHNELGARRRSLAAEREESVADQQRHCAHNTSAASRNDLPGRRRQVRQLALVSHRASRLLRYHRASRVSEERDQAGCGHIVHTQLPPPQVVVVVNKFIYRALLLLLQGRLLLLVRAERRRKTPLDARRQASSRRQLGNHRVASCSQTTAPATMMTMTNAMLRWFLV